MNPISAGRNPDTASTYREIYLNSLALEISNQTKNLNANRQFLATGQSGAEPADTRTTTEKYADYDRLKIEVRNKLREITDGIEAEKILNGLSKIETQFLSGQIDFVISDIKPRWKNGIPATAFVPYLRKLMRKYIETQGVDYGLQQPAGGNLPIPTVNNIPTVGYWQQFRNFVQEMMDGRIPAGYQLEAGLGADIPRYLLRPLGVNAPITRVNGDIQALTIPRAALARNRMPDWVRQHMDGISDIINRIIEFYPTQRDEETILAARDPDLLRAYETISTAVLNTIPRVSQLQGMEQELMAAANRGDEAYFRAVAIAVQRQLNTIEFGDLADMKRVVVRAETRLTERGQELPAYELSRNFVDVDAIPANPLPLAIQDIPDYAAEARQLQEGEVAPGVFVGQRGPDFQTYPYLESVQYYADTKGEFPILPRSLDDEQYQFPTPNAFPTLSLDEKTIFFKGATEHRWDLGNIRGEIADFLGGAELDPGDLNRYYFDIYENHFNPRGSSNFQEDERPDRGALPPRIPSAIVSPVKNQLLREAYPSVAAFKTLGNVQKLEIFARAAEDGFLEETFMSAVSRERLIALIADGDITYSDTDELNRWYDRLRKNVIDQAAGEKVRPPPPPAAASSFSSPIKDNPLQRTLSSPSPTGSGICGKGCGCRTCMAMPKRGRPKKSKNIIMGRGVAKINEDNIDWEQGIKPEPSYVPFGKHFINKFRLKDDVLMLRTMKGGTILSVPTQRVSKNLSKVLNKIVGGATPAFDDLNELNDDDKGLLFKMSKTSKVGDGLSVPNPDKLKQEREDRRFEILRGQIMAGQDNKDAIKEFKLILIKMMNNGRIPKAQAIDILTELTAIGH